jgi:hypothetical protein
MGRQQGQPEGSYSWRLALLSLLLTIAGLLWTSCGAPQAGGTRPPFDEEDKADIVIRYYSDGVNRVLKPKQMEGAFLSTFDVNGVLELAKRQPGRELAVVILIFFNTSDDVKLKWAGLLNGLGYRRVVFLRGAGDMRINGLSILDDPNPTSAPAKKTPESKAEIGGGSASLANPAVAN